ncbi:MAG: hypothetical protein P8X69_05030, partial [Maritimibacter sp.]
FQVFSQRICMDLVAPFIFLTERLPAKRSEIILGQAVPVIRRVDAAAFPSAIFALAKGGRWQDD